MCFSFEGMMRLGRFQCLSTWACFFFSLTGHWLSGSSQQLNSRVVPVQLSGYFIVCKVSCWLKLIALPVENLTLLLFCIHFLFSFYFIFFFSLSWLFPTIFVVALFAFCLLKRPARRSRNLRYQMSCARPAQQHPTPKWWSRLQRNR